MFIFCSYLLKRYGLNSQNDTKLETTSLAKKMVLDEMSFSQEIYGKRFKLCDLSSDSNKCSGSVFERFVYVFPNSSYAYSP